VANILDESMALSSNFNLDVRTEHFKKVVTAAELAEEALSIDLFPTRGIGNMRKLYVLFDIQRHWSPPPGATPESIVDSFVGSMNRSRTVFGEGQAAVDPYEGLPEGIRPGAALPENATMQLLVTKGRDGNLDVVKQYYFTGGATWTVISELVVGEARTCLFRENGGWAFKKAVQMILSRTPGVHANQYALSEKRAPANSSGGRGGNWNPTAAEIVEGIHYINAEMDKLDDEGANELLMWVWTKIRDPNSKVFEWPEAKVKEAASKRLEKKSGAEREYFFPLLHKEFKGVFETEITPKILPWAKEVGVMIAGMPGVGKTQYAKMMAMLLGRYWIDELKMQARRPCWRRGKKLERFRELTQMTFEMLMLDDPLLQLLDPEEVKDFFELTEIGSGSGRYKDCKYCLNGPRWLLTNQLDFDGEPGPMENCSTVQFWKMVSKCFGHVSQAHLMAIFKRLVCLIAGKNGVYLRLPSEDPDAPILSYHGDDICDDWVKPYNGGKHPSLSKYRVGVHVKYEGYDEAVEHEKEWVRSIMNRATTAQVGPPADTSTHHVPPSLPTQASTLGQRVHADADGTYRFAVPVTTTGARLSNRFRIPGRAAASHAVLVPAMKQELVDNNTLALAMTEAQKWAEEGPHVIADSPPRKKMKGEPSDIDFEIEDGEVPHVLAPGTPKTVKTEPFASQLSVAPIDVIDLSP
jgi:hypothetical protein